MRWTASAWAVMLSLSSFAPCCREHAPSIIFMDEVDSIGSARSESGGGGGGGDSEVQRTMLELLNQLDGFEATNKIKVRRGGDPRCRERAHVAVGVRPRRGRAGFSSWRHASAKCAAI